MRFYNLDEESKQKTPSAKMQIALMIDSEMMAHGYVSLIVFFQCIGRLFVQLTFLRALRPATWVILGLPVCMLTWVSIRFVSSVEVPRDIPSRQRFISFITDSQRHQGHGSEL